MGISSLLPFLKPSIKQSSLRQLRGKTCVIDIMSWLYRGAFAQAVEMNSKEQSLAFMCFPLRMIKTLISYNIKPICVFDGRPHEGKVDCEKKRSVDKEKNKFLAKQHEKEGNSLEARKYYTRCLFIKTKQILLFREILDELKIAHVTAPYEADAQMAYMVKEGLADFAITEDSDLIAFGCKTVLLKLNYAGFGDLFDLEEFRKESNTEKWEESLRTF